MIDDLWDKPVQLMVEGCDHFRSITNSRDAVACLSTCWPVEHDLSYSKAKRLCLNAARDPSRSKEAQAAFLHAAEEAGILRH